ncbi:phage protein NinX family protein [Proteus penneri]|uniref:phage protein NinX family protein n=1 Tax=Proteus penneri TaxID=102862 RepID=UPI00288B9AFF|nr:phage protein NinX family protein [Proteus penneri]
MNSYNKYTDLQINELVATRLKKKCLLTEESVLAYMNSGYRTFDPCNNPSDAMPIIIENEISMIKSSGGWMCCHGSVGQVERESLYRGAMELFLMMKDAENENNNNG